MGAEPEWKHFGSCQPLLQYYELHKTLFCTIMTLDQLLEKQKCQCCCLRFCVLLLFLSFYDNAGGTKVMRSNREFSSSILMCRGLMLKDSREMTTIEEFTPSSQELHFSSAKNSKWFVKFICYKI